MKTLRVFFFGFVFLFGFSALAYFGWFAHQDIQVRGDAVELGDADSVVVRVSAPEGKKLVPIGTVWCADETDAAVYVYDVAIASGETLEVEVASRTIELGGLKSDDVHSLLVIDVDVAMTSATHATVTCTVGIRMPETEAEYRAIAGGSVSFSLSFHRNGTS